MSRSRSSRNDILLSAALVVGVAACVVVLWILVVKIYGLPRALLPLPKEVWDAATLEREALLKGSLSTAVAATAGLATAVVVGSLISLGFSQSRKIRMAFFPYVVFLQTVPIVGIAPLLIIWSGYTFRTVVIATTIICLFPIVNNATAGLLAGSKDLSDLFRLYGSGRRKRLVLLQIPTAIPYLMLGARISSGLAVIGAIVGEFFVGNGSSYAGLGALMTGWIAFGRTDALIAALFCSTLVGLLLFASVQLIATLFLGRWTRVE